MPERKFEEIIKDLKNKVYHPIYFLQGEEPFYIDAISDFISTHVLNDMEKEFNQTILYGRDSDIFTIVSAARRFPMMANYQVVVVKEAQDIKWFSQKEKDKDEKDPMLTYLLNPTKSTLLVLCYKYKTIDARTRNGKMIKEKTQFFESKKLYDNQVPAWIEKYIKEKNHKADERAITMLADYLGNDLSKISNEIDKILINLKDEQAISTNDIHNQIGISKEYNVFELQHALGEKNILKANRIINYFAANPKSNPFVLIIGNLFAFFNKLIVYQFAADKTPKGIATALGINPFFVKDYDRAAKNYSIQKLENIISILREYDLKSKGVNSTDKTTDGDLLKELIFKILH
jgi:DNA polymerase-3 subunit delta